MSAYAVVPFALLIALASSSAAWAEPAPVTREANPRTTGQADAQVASDGSTKAKLPYWGRGRSRFFVAGEAFMGAGVARGVFQAGYGKPHWFWAGFETVGALSPLSSSLQTGLRASAVVLDLSAAVRRTDSFWHTELPPLDRVTASDLSRDGVPRQGYFTFVSTLRGVVPYGRLLMPLEVTYLRPLAQSDSQLIYEESERLVVTGRGLLAYKVSPMLRVLDAPVLYTGVRAEFFSVFGRSDNPLFRVGPGALLKLADHWDLFCFVGATVHSHDDLGLLNGMNGALLFLYRFASGDE